MTPDVPLVLIPFPRIAVPGSERRRVVAWPTEFVRPRYLVVPRSIAQDFSILDLKIGKTSQLHASPPTDPETEADVLAEVFAGDPEVLEARETEASFLRKASLDHPIPLELDPAGPGLPITLEVANLNPACRLFSATIFAVLSR